MSDRDGDPTGRVGALLRVTREADMTLLSPLALLWLGAIPVLLWLWRLASTHRQVQVPSLVPFEHLLKRPPRRRTRLLVNALFWLQLAALIGLALVLAQPALVAKRAKTILAVLDTSASMSARLHGASRFEQAKQSLLTQIARKAITDEWLVMTTAPVSAITPHPTSDGTVLARAIHALRVSHLGGNLATTARIGRAILGTAPDAMLIVTDEPRPMAALESQVQWLTVAQPLPNLAIVGLDALGPLCAPTQAHVVVTVQNFSRDAATATITVTQGGRRLANVSTDLASLERRALSLVLPEQVDGWVELELTGGRDSLAPDNHAWLNIHHAARLPVVLRVQEPALARTLSGWLGACQSLAWSKDVPTDHRAYLLMTDHEEPPSPRAAAMMTFLLPPTSDPILSHWMAAADHPISSYLGPLEVVALPLNLSSEVSPVGLPVVSALVHGHKVAIVMAGEEDGRRMVSIRFDPSRNAQSTPVLLTFFNSLSWLMGQAEGARTGEPLTIDRFASGAVQVHRPDGSTETVPVESGVLRYEATTFAGLYRFTQHTSAVMVGVNFFDPVESNLLDPVSTWRPLQDIAAGTQQQPRSLHPLTQPLLALLLILLLIEWWLYCVRARMSFPAMASRSRGEAPPSSPPTSSRVEPSTPTAFAGKG